jgi:hypothetical protein
MHFTPDTGMWRAYFMSNKLQVATCAFAGLKADVSVRPTITSFDLG